jgi:Cytochrome c554 and c-prime
MDGLADAEVSSAAANIAIHSAVDVFICGLWCFGEQRGGGHHLAGLAVAALRDVDFRPGKLDGMRAVRGEPLDRSDLHICGGSNRSLTGAHGVAVEVHGARAAEAHTAAVFCAAQIQDVAKNPQKGHVLGDVHGGSLAVHVQFVGHDRFLKTRIAVDKSNVGLECYRVAPKLKIDAKSGLCQYEILKSQFRAAKGGGVYVAKTRTHTRERLCYLPRMRLSVTHRRCFSAALCLLPVAGYVFAQSSSQGIGDFSQFRPRQEIAGVEFVGPEVCAKCHTQVAETQARSVMAHGLRNAADSAILRSHARLTFQAGPYSYEIVREGGSSSYRVSKGNETTVEPLLYAFGSAHIAQTFVYRHNGRLQEARVSYYTGIDALDWTIGDTFGAAPSVEDAAGRDISGQESRNCFSCHGTAALADNKLQLERLIPGVTCEACHGPGAKHVAAMRSGDLEHVAIFNPRKLGAEALSQEVCGACHRSADTVAMMPDLGGLSNVRFQPYRLSNSRGHDLNDSRFACTACHDPHSELERAGHDYDGKCVSCHAAEAGTKAKLCPVAKEKCVSCHMPKVDLPGAHFQFTDHSIRIARPGEPYPY